MELLWELRYVLYFFGLWALGGLFVILGQGISSLKTNTGRAPIIITGWFLIVLYACTLLIASERGLIVIGVIWFFISIGLSSDWGEWFWILILGPIFCPLYAVIWLILTTLKFSSIPFLWKTEEKILKSKEVKP